MISYLNTPFNSVEYFSLSFTSPSLLCGLQFRRLFYRRVEQHLRIFIQGYSGFCVHHARFAGDRTGNVREQIRSTFLVLTYDI